MHGRIAQSIDERSISKTAATVTQYDASLPQINLGVQGETQVGHHTVIEKTIVGRDPKCPSTSRLRMVREDTGTPTEGSTCAWMAADEEDGCTGAFLTMWWSSR
ncbi:hypothetical protein TNCV_1413101 [Trichonephila clavipes]|nr:hypothetical protein TNCV_1413101 [Trichonephila clavipes]